MSALGRDYLIAHCRGRITELGLTIRARLGLPIDTNLLQMEIAKGVYGARFRSQFIPWNLDDTDVDTVIRRVASDLGGPGC